MFVVGWTCLRQISKCVTSYIHLWPVGPEDIIKVGEVTIVLRYFTLPAILIALRKYFGRLWCRD